jgi:tetratricopeptide (TPR) repeat protein
MLQTLPLRQLSIAIVILLLVTFCSLAPVVANGFVDYDDEGYVTTNPYVKAGLTRESIGWAFTTTQECHWHPLTWLSLELDCQLHGLNPAGFHFTSLLLHLVSAILLLLLLSRITGRIWPSATVAILFAIHPVHVESVAWIADRKDVLCGFFWLLALSTYVAYIHRSGPLTLILLMTAFAFGLMAKSTLVTLPVALLLLDYWPLCRWNRSPVNGYLILPRRSWQRLVLEKMPLFMLSAAFCAVAWYAQHHEGVGNTSEPLGARLQNSVASYGAYLAKVFWPVGLIPFYPLPMDGFPIWKVAGSLLVLVTISWAATAYSKPIPALLAGWCWFLVTLLPVIGVLQVLGGHAMADRYAYIPLIGIFMALVGCLTSLGERSPIGEAIAAGALGIATIACLVLTRVQVGYWHDSASLWEHTIRVDPGNHVAHNSLGVWRMNQGKRLDARSHFVDALKINSHYGPAHNNLGLLLAEEGDFEGAAAHLEAAMKVNSDLPASQNVLGGALTQLGRLHEGEQHLREALRLKSNDPGVHNNLGLNLKRQGKVPEAVAEYQEALRLQPAHLNARSNLAAIWVQEGRLADAEAELRQALRTQPDDADLLSKLGLILGLEGKHAEAVSCYRHALSENPENALNHANLAFSVEVAGQHDEAAVEYGIASRIDPNWPERVRQQAWVLATSPEIGVRNGTLSLHLARLAARGIDKPDCHFLDTLAAAYAEVGRYEDALITVGQALATLGANQPRLAESMRQRQSRYQQHEPWREPRS